MEQDTESSRAIAPLVLRSTMNRTTLRLCFGTVVIALRHQHIRIISVMCVFLFN